MCELKFIDPIEVEECRAFILGKMVYVSLPVYKETYQGKKIRECRKSHGVGLRKAAKLIGISATKLSKIQKGAAVFVKEDDFDNAINVIENY